MAGGKRWQLASSLDSLAVFGECFRLDGPKAKDAVHQDFTTPHFHQASQCCGTQLSGRHTRLAG